MSDLEKEQTPAGEGAALGYFSHVTMASSPPFDYSAGLNSVARAIAVMAIILGGANCISFLFAHGGFEHQPYDWPWTHGSLVGQVHGWSATATDLSAPLLALGGLLTIKRRNGGLRALTGGAVAYFIARASAFAEVMCFQTNWNLLRQAGATFSILFWQVSELFPSLLLLVLVTRAAVRTKITMSVVDESAPST